MNPIKSLEHLCDSRKDFECILPLAYLLQRGLLVGKMTLPENPLVYFKAFYNTSFDG